MKPDDIINIVSIIGLALPVVINLTKYIGAATHNTRISNLASRADIVVKALEQSQALSNEDKKTRAIAALNDYAKEVGIKVSPEQLSQYIDSSVNTIRQDQATEVIETKPEKNQRLN